MVGHTLLHFTELIFMELIARKEIQAIKRVHHDRHAKEELTKAKTYDCIQYLVGISL